MATLDAKCDATSTHDTCTRYVRISSSILVVLNFPSSLCFLLDRYLFFLSSTVSVSLLVVPYSPFPEICLPSGRDRPFGATGCSRVPIVGAHNATRAAIDRAHLVSSNGGRTAVTSRKRREREGEHELRAHKHTRARVRVVVVDGHGRIVVVRVRACTGHVPPRTASTFHHGGSATDRATAASNRRPPAKVVPRVAETANRAARARASKFASDAQSYVKVEATCATYRYR